MIILVSLAILTTFNRPRTDSSSRIKSNGNDETISTKKEPRRYLDAIFILSVTSSPSKFTKIVLKAMMTSMKKRALIALSRMTYSGVCDHEGENAMATGTDKEFQIAQMSTNRSQ